MASKVTSVLCRDFTKDFFFFFYKKQRLAIDFSGRFLYGDCLSKHVQTTFKTWFGSESFANM